MIKSLVLLTGGVCLLTACQGMFIVPQEGPKEIDLPFTAQAADPSDVYDPATDGQYDATQSVRFQTPEFDESGFPLQEGDLTRCVVDMNGNQFVLNTATTPDVPVTFPTPASVSDTTRFGTVGVFCSTSAGDGEAVVADDARFRDAGTPGGPTLLK